MREFKAGRRRTGKPSAAAASDDARPLIRVIAGELPRVVDEAESSLIAANADIFQRAGIIVRPAPFPDLPGKDAATMSRIVEVLDNHLVEEFTRHARWERFDKRIDDWVSIDAPLKIAATYLERVGKWRLRSLSGIVSAPTLRPDGSILSAPGYDVQTGLLFDPCGAEFPTIPPRPTRAQAITALGDLQMLIQSFDFEDRVSCSVAISAILTALVRGSLRAAPLHGFTAPVAGSGKSKLVDLASMIATGRPASVLSQGRTEEETEKRLAGVLLSGDQVITFDNCERSLGGDLLAQAITQSVLKIRPLGRSDTMDVPSRATFFATANNLVIGGDLARRTLICKLDPKCERPEQRTFRTDPVAVARVHRGRLVSGALTILRAFHVAGRPSSGMGALGSFEDWSDWVRGALIWLGESDPVSSMEAARAADPVVQALSSVAEQWWVLLGDKRVTATEVIGVATTRNFQTSEFSNAEFREALLVVAGDGGAINGMRLGRWLGKHKDRISKGFCFRAAAERRSGMALWELRKVSAP